MALQRGGLPQEKVQITKYVEDGSQGLLGIVEDSISRLERIVNEGQMIVRTELAKFVWSTARKIRMKINPHPIKKDQATQHWVEAKGMLKDVIDFEKFNPGMFRDDCVKFVLEKKVLEVLQRYATFVATGEVQTKRLPPKVLGETDEILCVDKPINYTCEYGGSEDAVPVVSNAASASALLNSEAQTVQIHEYLARKYNYETAVRTREFWLSGSPLPCNCGTCEKCACVQSGCCNRLDRETSGVMVVAKTPTGFGEVRKQFASENQHTIQLGGIEKYYLALARGSVAEPDGGRGEVTTSEVWHPLKGRAFAAGSYELETDHKGNPYMPPAGVDMKPMWAKTYYEPIAWYRSVDREEEYTLLRIQIITGRRHQIRFHCSEIGHPLVGDPKYGAPLRELDWCVRMFLHSYQTRFREPFTDRWFQATSPIPPELGKLLSGLKRTKVREPPLGTFLSRRDNDLAPVFEPYDPADPLLKHIELQADGEVMVLNGSAPVSQNVANGSKRRRVTVPAFNAEKIPTTPLSPQPQPVLPLAHAPNQQAQPLPVGPLHQSPPPLQQQQQQQQQQPPVPSGVAAQAPPAAAAPASSAGWKRMESRSQPGVFYYFQQETGATMVEPPPPWEKRFSRSKPDVFYYWNPNTGQTSPGKPEV